MPYMDGMGWLMFMSRFQRMLRSPFDRSNLDGIEDSTVAMLRNAPWHSAKRQNM